MTKIDHDELAMEKEEESIASAVLGERLAHARWIWPFANMDLVNCLAQFRRDFHLKKIPRRAQLAITADQQYRLWINGHYVCRGPARGYQNSWPVDIVNAKGFLRPGANWISIEAYNPGISTYRYIHRGVAGLLCVGLWKGAIYSGDSKWRMRRSPSHIPFSARLSRQLDFQEHVEIGADDRSWIYSEKIPERTWEGDGARFDVMAGGRPFGCLPWTAVESRGIPLLDESIIVPLRAVGFSRGKNEKGWISWRNVAWPFQAEGSASSWIAFNGKSERNKEWLEIEMPSGRSDEWRAISIDVGEYTCASAEIEIESADAIGCLDFYFHERLVGLRGDLRSPGSACLIALANRIRLTNGVRRHDFFHLLGFGVISVIARGISHRIKIRIRLRTGLYPFPEAGSLSCSDGNIEAIYRACLRTQRICSTDAYVDTPWREQAQWWGDAQVQAANTAHLFGDMRLLERGIRSIAGQIGPEGLTFGHAPTCAYHCIIPDFSLTWLLTIHDHWWYTGKGDLTRDLWRRALAVLSYFDSVKARHPSGLLLNDKRFWLFEDWSDLWKGEVTTFLNLWYIYVLQRLAKCLRGAGMAHQARLLAQKWRMHADLTVRLLFDEKRKAWRAGLGAKAGDDSIHDQTISMMAGLRPDAHENILDRYLRPYLQGKSAIKAQPSAFWSHYVLTEAADRGEGLLCIEFIRRHWSVMAKGGTTWEGFDWREDADGSASHAWTAHPCVHFSRILGGIRQRSAGWTDVDISPQIIAGIDFCESIVPTPGGRIAVRWKRISGNRDAIDLDVEFPESTKMRVTLGGKRLPVKDGHRGRWKINTKESDSSC